VRTGEPYTAAYREVRGSRGIGHLLELALTEYVLSSAEQPCGLGG
jgi:hypothetical protein